MSHAADAKDDQTGRFAVPGKPRPLSPHLQVWRWHVTMLASILFRVTIGAVSVGALIVLGWLAALAFGPEAYTGFLTVAASPFGLFIGFGLTVVLFSFILNGARHETNDLGVGLDLKTANTLASLCVWGPVVLAVLFWAALFATGRAVL